MKITIPIGTEFFAKLREQNYYFVDKTPFLSEFLRDHADITLITRPRRFGKTLLLSMMHRFLDIENAEGNRKLFEGLKVMDDPEAMAEQGTHPVVFLKLKEWKADTWEAMQKVIAHELQNAFRPLRYLLKDDKISPIDKKYFDNICDGNAEPIIMGHALLLICKMLKSYYGRDVVVLIDDYDAPLRWAIAHGYYKKANSFYHDFFGSALKTNFSLDFALLTGVMYIPEESSFTGLNNIVASTVIRGKFKDACGYTKRDVEKLAKDLGHEDKLEEITEWYGGYNFNGVDIYNPWSVNSYFEAGCNAQRYWPQLSGNSIIQTMLEQLDRMGTRRLKSLMEGKTTAAYIEDSFAHRDIENHQANLYSALLAEGYFKCVEDAEDEYKEIYNLSIPNKEISCVFRDEILKCLPGSGEQKIYEDLLKAVKE